MKKHTIARVASVFLAAAMMAGNGLTAYAVSPASSAPASPKTASSSGTKNDEAMKTALTKVKKRVSIPERLTEFSYSSDRNLSTDCYHFTWTSPNDSKAKFWEQLEINIVGDIITLYNYSKYYNDKEADPDLKRSNSQSFAKLSDAQLIEKAKAHLKMLDPDIVGEAEFSVSKINLFGKDATVQFSRKKNGLYVDGNGGSINLDKDTGELLSFRLTWFRGDTVFPDASKVMTKDEAIAAFKKLCTLTPAYTVNYDWSTGEKSAALVYRPNFTDEIDAVTGEASSIWADMNSDGGSQDPPWSWSGSVYYANPMTGGGLYDEGENDCAYEEEVTFSAAEMREIEADESMLKKDDIKKLLQKDKYIALPGWVPLESSNLYKNDDGDYFYQMQFSSRKGEEPVADESGTTYATETSYYYLSVNVNAKTGKVTSFSKNFDGSYDDSIKYPVSANSKKAEEVKKYFYPDIAGEYIADKNNSSPAEFYTDKQSSGEGKKRYEVSRNFIFNRHVNGVIVEGDKIQVTIDNKGNVTRVNYTYSNVNFPSVPKFDNEKAFSQLFKQQEMSLYYDGYYKKDGTIKTYLIYNTSYFTLDRNYKLCGYNGKPVEKTASADVSYSDIKGTKYEKAVTTLARYGIVLPSEGGKFEPEKSLTDKEFAVVVYGVLFSYVPYSIKEGNYGGDDTKAVTLTNGEAAKVFVTAGGGQGYAELKGIYKSPFTDVPESSKYVGYIAIAKASGYMKGSGGKFEPDKKISRGRAMQIIYEFVESQN